MFSSPNKEFNIKGCLLSLYVKIGIIFLAISFPKIENINLI